MPRFSCRSRKASSAVAAGRHTPKDGSGVPIAATTKSDRSRTPSLEDSCRRKCRNSSSAPRRIAVSSASSGRGRSNRRRVPKARSRAVDVAAVAVDQAADSRPHLGSRSRSLKRRPRVRNRANRKNRKKRVQLALVVVAGDSGGVAAVVATGRSRPPRASAARAQGSAAQPASRCAAGGSAANVARYIRRNLRSECSSGLTLRA